MNQRVVCGGFIVRNGKFLLAKRADNDTFLPGMWEIPGGKLEFGEHPEDGTKREILEEVGLEVELISPISTWMYDSFSHDTQYIQIDFLCKPVDGSEVKLSEEHSDYAWIRFDEIDNFKLSPQMKKELLKMKSYKLIENILRMS